MEVSVRNVRTTVLIAGLFWVAVVAVCPGASKAKARVLRFPKNRSMGIVKVLTVAESEDGRLEFGMGMGKLEYFAEARGIVRVPEGKKVMLAVVGWEALDDLSPLARLGADDLDGLSVGEIPNRPMGNPDMTIVPHIRHLRGLEVLQLNSNFTDKGLQFLNEFKSLKELWVLSREFGNEGLAQVGKLKSLEVLFFFGGRITDAGMSHLDGLVSLRKLRFVSPKLSQIRGPGIAALSKLPALEYLDVRGHEF